MERLAAAGRVVMISGASRGIGAAIARRLYDDGYTLSLGMRQPQQRDDARVLIARYEAEDAASAQAWVAATMARFGRIDALINNAGIFRVTKIDDADERELDTLWAVNVKGPLRLIRATMPPLRRSGHGR